MDFSHYTDYPVQLAMDLVNTRSPVSGDDRLGDVDGLRAFLDDVADHLWHPPWTLTQDDVEDVRQLRQQLRTVFHAASDAEAADLLNAVLRTSRAIPTVSVHEGAEPHLHFEPDDAGVAAWLGAVTGMGMSVVLCDHDIGRLGVCGSTSCEDVYIDTSRNRSRRYCCDTCANRENVAAYRRRRKPVTEPSL